MRATRRASGLSAVRSAAIATLGAALLALSGCVTPLVAQPDNSSPDPAYAQGTYAYSYAYPPIFGWPGYGYGAAGVYGYGYSSPWWRPYPAYGYVPRYRPSPGATVIPPSSIGKPASPGGFPPGYPVKPSPGFRAPPASKGIR